MWETLSNVEGDGCFVDANFKTLTTSPPVVPSVAPNIAQPPPPTAGITQEDQEYVILPLLDPYYRNYSALSTVKEMIDHILNLGKLT